MRKTTSRDHVALVLLLAALGGGPAAQRGPAPSARLPPISMTCPHHPDVIESAPGTCPECRMTLVPVRLDAAWTCPVHPVTISDEGGSCPLCRRALVPVTVSLTYTCGASADETIEPGVCADGRRPTLKRTLRPHGDHNPRHGGQFFMAGDNWHHVEGVYPSRQQFRLYVYDDYGRPLQPDRLRRIQARVVTSERFDPATKQYIELRAFPLRAARDGAWLEAPVERASLPLELTAKLRFARDAAEYRFDFTFHGLTPASPAAPPAAAIVRPDARAGTRTPPRPPSAAPPRAPAAPRPPEPAPAEPDGASAPDPALTPVPIPETVAEMIEQLRTRNTHVGILIARGDFTAVWVPAFAAKDLAVALEPHVPTLDAARRERTAAALQRIVRTAWLLDAVGDAGHRDQLAAAHMEFGAAIAEVTSAFEAR